MQIDWGIANFIHRFGRDPEGMRLPEAAINASIVDMLSEAGIRFVIYRRGNAALGNVWTGHGLIPNRSLTTLHSSSKGPPVQA